MQTIVPELVVSQQEQILDYELKFGILFLTLPNKGLDRLTDSRIEHVICTSALAAFN